MNIVDEVLARKRRDTSGRTSRSKSFAELNPVSTTLNKLIKNNIRIESEVHIHSN